MENSSPSIPSIHPKEHSAGTYGGSCRVLSLGLSGFGWFAVLNRKLGVGGDLHCVFAVVSASPR